MKANTKKRIALSIGECTLLRECCNDRINGLRKAIDKCAGSLWPGIYAGQIDRIGELFLKLTGEPLTDPEE